MHVGNVDMNAKSGTKTRKKYRNKKYIWTERNCKTKHISFCCVNQKFEEEKRFVIYVMYKQRH